MVEVATGFVYPFLWNQFNEWVLMNEFSFIQYSFYFIKESGHCIGLRTPMQAATEYENVFCGSSGLNLPDPFIQRAGPALWRCR